MFRTCLTLDRNGSDVTKVGHGMCLGLREQYTDGPFDEHAGFNRRSLAIDHISEFQVETSA